MNRIGAFVAILISALAVEPAAARDSITPQMKIKHTLMCKIVSGFKLAVKNTTQQTIPMSAVVEIRIKVQRGAFTYVKTKFVRVSEPKLTKREFKPGQIAWLANERDARSCWAQVTLGPELSR